MAKRKGKPKHLLREADVKTPFAVRLQRAVGYWQGYISPMLKAQRRMLEHYAAGWYRNEEQYAQPLNLIDRAVQILGPYLVSQNPKVMVDPKRDLKKNQAFARTYELALEHLMKEIRFAENTLRPAVTNSLFSMGIVKTGITLAHQVEIFGYLHDVGQPYADVIQFEDYIGDCNARNRQESQIEGNEYWLPEEYVKTCGLYKHYDRLRPYEEDRGENDVESVSKRNQRNSGYWNLRPMVKLIDLWIPDEDIVVTVPPEGQGRKPLRIVDHDGPETGPYEILGYRHFPKTIIPIPPMFVLLHLNTTINRMVTTMNRQALRNKKVVFYERGASDDVSAAIETNDGFTAGIKNADSLKEVEFGGVSETNFPYMQWLESQYSITGGNLYTIGGRSAQADTLGQEQMLQANASKQLQDMVTQVHTFTRNIIEKMAWYLWTDPFIEIPMVKRYRGLEIEAVYSREVQEGDFWDYGYDIEPYSMTMDSPELRYQKLMQLIAQVVMPTAQIAAAQGSQLNVNELVKEAARYMNVRNIDDWWASGIPQQVAMNPYQPMQASTKGASGAGMGDGRFDSGNDPASRQINQQQQQTRTGGAAADTNVNKGGY